MAKKKKEAPSNNTKYETMDEYLARGGKIEVIPAVKPNEPHIVQNITVKVPHLYTWEEANFYFSEKEKKPKKVKQDSFSLNIKDLPADIREKWVDKAITIAIRNDDT